MKTHPGSMALLGLFGGGEGRGWAEEEEVAGLALNGEAELIQCEDCGATGRGGGRMSPISSCVWVGPCLAMATVKTKSCCKQAPIFWLC